MSSPPALPLRKNVAVPVPTPVAQETVPDLPVKFPNGLNKAPLELAPITSHLPLQYNLDDDLSTICVSRQLESYLSPTMNENSDIFNTNESILTIMSRKLELLAIEEEPTVSTETQFWIKFIHDLDDKLVRDHQVDKLEAAIEQGIPIQLRGTVYLKTLRVRSTLSKETYDKLLKKAESSDTIRNQTSYFQNVSGDQGLKEVLKIFNYYTTEVAITSGTGNLGLDKIANSDILYESSQHLPPSEFIYNLAKLLTSSASFPGISCEESLLILLKFNHLFHDLIKDEFLYKVLRSLETVLSEEFLHITKQGIELTLLHKKILTTFFGEIRNCKVLIQLLDYFLFEGFDYIVRVIVAIFNANSKKIFALECDDLAKFLYSSEFFAIFNDDDSEFQLKEVLKFQPSIIKFENEYHLLNANSMTRNRNELLNLKEVNEDLEKKIREIKHLLHNLGLTHKEILDQSDSYKKQLEDIQAENHRLLKAREEIKEQYENLSMKENVQNTIRANEEFAQTNKELEEQIRQLKTTIELKRAKITKISS